MLAVIYILLYVTYHSLLEAAHMLGSALCSLGGHLSPVRLGYNISVAVWVGFIALFGTAVQTAVVMVIYLEEAVVRKRQELGRTPDTGSPPGGSNRGALLRLRPKVMTVSTVVASLLPIMWSHSTGAEVMKPLATPVLGGMVSSLAHVLLVTPVIFSWLRERELRRETEREAIRQTSPSMGGRHVSWPMDTVSQQQRGETTDATPNPASRVGYGTTHRSPRSARLGGRSEGDSDTESEDMTIALLSESGQWTQGKNTFVLEFTSAATKQPVDVGKVTLSTSMPMPGMAPMLAGATLSPDKAPGRYLGMISFPDRGARQVTVAWDGPAGKGSTQFSVPVR